MKSRAFHLLNWAKAGSALSCRYEESALQKKPDALVGVEVAVHTDCVFIDGRIAAGPQRVDIEKIVRDVDRAPAMAAHGIRIQGSDEQINYWPAAHSVSGELGRRLLKKYLTANEAVRGAQPMSGGHRVTEEIDFMRV